MSAAWRDLNSAKLRLSFGGAIATLVVALVFFLEKHIGSQGSSTILHGLQKEAVHMEKASCCCFFSVPRIDYWILNNFLAPAPSTYSGVILDP